MFWRSEGKWVIKTWLVLMGRTQLLESSTQWEGLSYQEAVLSGSQLEVVLAIP